MNGINGHNIRILNGLSRDMARAAQARARGAFALCMDDPALVVELKAIGAKTIYRQSGDDPARNPLPESNKSADIKGAAVTFTDERGKKNADYVHLTNELSSSPKLHEFTRYCLERCKSQGWKGVAYNYATHTPKQQYVDALDNLRYAAATEQAWGIHMYPDIVHDATVAEFLSIRRSLNIECIATEFNYTLDYTDPHHGWRNVPESIWRSQGHNSIEDFRRGFIRKWSQWLDDNDIPVTWFCLDYWDQPNPEEAKRAGYGYFDLDDVLDEMAVQNRVHVYTGVPIVTNCPDPTTLGDLQAGTVVPNSNYANVRSECSTSGAVLRQVYAGTEIQYHPTLVEGGVYNVKPGVTDNRWMALDRGWLAAGVVTVTSEVVDTPLLKLDVPHNSQSAPTAGKWKNDCGVACALMILRWRMKQAGLLDPTLITVDEMSAHTSLVTNDDGLTLAEVETLLKGYGVTCRITRPLTPDAIIERLLANDPPLALVNYKPIGGQKFGHYVVITGYGQHGFWLNDPYTKGADYYITREDLDEALRDTLDFGAQYPYQGIVSA